MRRIVTHSVVALALAASAFAAAAAPGCPALPAQTPMPIEATPSAVDVPEWRDRVAVLGRQLAGKDLSAVQLVFIGDSITQGWDPAMWSLFWGDRSALNLGIWGDLTQGVLWRLHNGQWNPSLKPKLAVLLIGTNNAGWKSRPEDTALGVAEIIRFIQSQSPKTKVLVLGLLPRGADASAPERPINDRVNALIRSCADNRSVAYLEPGHAMIDSTGALSQSVMFDFLHPTMVGYAILGAQITDKVHEMMSR